MNTKTKIEDASRARIAEFLPDALLKAMRSYQEFVAREDAAAADGKAAAKAFSEHHSACKVALAHIDLLLKLARWADLPDPADEDANRRMILEAVIGEAESELRASPYIDAEFEEE